MPTKLRFADENEVGKRYGKTKYRGGKAKFYDDGVVQPVTFAFALIYCWVSWCSWEPSQTNQLLRSFADRRKATGSVLTSGSRSGMESSFVRAAHKQQSSRVSRFHKNCTSQQPAPNPSVNEHELQQLERPTKIFYAQDRRVSPRQCTDAINAHALS